MFATMPRTGRIAFVVAQHMAKNGHDELVARLIGRESALPVELVRENTQLTADRVYVIPSGKDGRVQENTLCLAEPSAEHLSTPSVNALLSSIATSAHGKAIGIVLSGTGTDGVNGCRAIRNAGGLTIAQDPQEAKFDGMPTAAIEAHLIDQILPVQSIGQILSRKFSDRASAPAPAHDDAGKNRELAHLLQQVLHATGIDFSSYKEDTLLRRLEKRMAMLGMASSDDYQTRIRSHPEELRMLQHLFLVSLSSFFRDQGSFEVLKRSLEKLVASKPEHEAIRIWVPGCASGEEPYTLAILLRELTSHHAIEITATDLNPEALKMAREAVYRQTAFKEMATSLRDRYFQPRGQHYALRSDISACVSFEQRDVLTGTPLEELDLVSCRNLLIYMKSHLQDQLVKTFHQALRSRGLLFIGQSESLSFVGNTLFVPIDHYHRLFCKRH